MKPFCLLLIAACFISCHSSTSEKKEPGADSIAYGYDHIPAERSTINPNPVKTYRETIKSFETTDQFVVSLYETKETFHYLIKFEYKNLGAEDTLKVPNFGTQPSVEIVRGETRPSCVVGFLDKDKNFRESKLIYFEDNQLKVHVLKHYGVATYQDSLKK
ncbi:MAG TPA: hypothetical protein VEV83_11765 [Parafilimonas sp.]|nr:hypothetical protein [Parafilimonas sp.]